MKKKKIQKPLIRLEKRININPKLMLKNNNFLISNKSIHTKSKKVTFS